MRHGIVILPQEDWPAAARRWRGAEAYGFDHAWSYDHLSWRSLADQRWHATVPAMTAAAVMTERIGLGFFVASPNFRHPVPFAKELATLDDISGGRLLVGVGSGGTGFDAFVLGQPELSARERHARFIEFADALDVLLRFEQPGSGGISFSGQWYTAHDARMVGTPTRAPRMPLLIAGNGPQTIRYAATRGEGWVTTGPDAADREEWWSGVAKLAARFEEEHRASGRQDGVARVLSLDNESFYSLQSAAAFEDSVARAETLGFTDVVAHWPRKNGLYAGDESVLDQVAASFEPASFEPAASDPAAFEPAASEPAASEG
ncbi:LLM class flavin-dependent oxidoreductase [Microbacterium rhizomatis]|uniref:LLM class flavin-dependent oxidoreductase n=1 Tax=Microbacterium rhizomatis TaxID=1631477 RepID=A0A5J5J8T3_9MICO|nr:LLM class flavin-dependent oxidoreductase [Microbacterium rhizomatis]KAA9111425.1 LLM class flavin-dependent oxidoreductase [Microbacterium rhizomatis]